MADLHFSPMPRDFLTESVTSLRLSKFGNNDCADKTYSPNDSVNRLLLPADLNAGDKSLLDRKEHKEKNKSFRKYSELTPPSVSSSYENYGSAESKSNSLPGRCNNSSPVPNTTVATEISADDLASQLTLLDACVFKCIEPHELSNCSWNKKNKLITAPNVVSFTRRFNHTSFWTVQEILNAPTPKMRAEFLAHFIRVAKKLYDLNNLHSLFAIISALHSASVYRLNKTWAYLSKKDKAAFDKLAEVFNDKSNWSNLREHMDNIKLPCIPYLGLFLTDLVYIDMAHPASKNGDNHQRVSKMNAVLTKLAMFQACEYPGIIPLPDVQRYLNSVRYIEELQKFLEDDHFKLSMRLEPNSPIPSSSSSKESVENVATGVAALSLSPARGCAGSLRLHTASAATKFVPGHRKCRSLGTKFRSTSLPRNFHKQGGKYGPDTTTPGIFGKSVTVPLEAVHITARHLLDDSVLEEPHLVGAQLLDLDHNSPGSPADAVSEDCRLLQKKSQVLPCDIDSSIEPRCIMQGSLRRKVVLRDGRKPAVSTWQRYWVQLWASSVVYFAPKCFKGCIDPINRSERSDFKREPYKMISILGWIVETLDDKVHSDTFLLADPKKGNVYKFRATSVDSSEQWLRHLRATVRGAMGRRPLPANLMSFE
ncbi:ras-specific guanine nucleotide-releasing factor RalGPS2-like isoform X1 [Trichogramma pretiosum]|uniref:ras-specific guanine nucleotide-releasing factor RalGPS2-like isoform X1 n=1 Tax=Trichogramma pretiosum TaxID=7493 RepID=UPI0006C94410|nr:ras-specific guanine nucleotide-releasing factor RalGPS2-like isoform X1 [Trichogramma pretiosum]XP_014227623.1 ras-specific guanine nucleotide-releasing factor RalGPS2-like isoform X1 [Trichogramma pretiosum]XP_014227624.1 ras-specific guanine nucleotide-releasing factor RalGPS2-like isoform X1 [Trichogramma pretiosum]XP_014227625.1 ras-specific guanine nucleotide-releasing factor RalGPS2-like isoform X1 [Trichogramma pretiosum]XP_014227626.1 ras-specific guanine nucleotide-releasing factor